jgi:glycosyltransferase involved in cell wall biosynthesis
VTPDVTQAPARLRVALDATPLLGHPTGVGVFTRGALQALGARTDLDVRAFAVSWRRRQGIADQLPPGVTVSQRPMPARPLHAAWARGNRPAIESFIGAVDVVHGTNFVVPPTRRAGAVVSVHDLTPIHFPELCNAATLAYPDLIRRAVARGAWVHTDSEFVADEVRSAFAVDPERVVAVAPGVPDLPAGSPGGPSATIERLLPAGTTRYVLAIGTAEPRKDLPGLVRAFDALASESESESESDLALCLAGPVGWGEDALTAAIAQSPHAARIIRTGWVSDQELADLLHGAAVLAYPSVYEGFGFPPLQAMQAGTPVVATRAGSLPEVLGDAAALVPAGEPGELAAALSRVLSHDGYRQQLITAGHAQAARYQWADCGEGLAELYRNVDRARSG